MAAPSARRLAVSGLSNPFACQIQAKNEVLLVFMQQSIIRRRFLHGSRCRNRTAGHAAIPSCRHFSTESEGDTQSDSFRTNEGVVEGVWMFIRHGDRAPSRPLCPPHRRDEEAAYWVTRLPYPDTATAFAKFSKRFPLLIQPGTNQGSFIDVHRNPFGFLTLSGLDQLRETGHRFFNRYNHHGYHLPDHDKFSYEGAQDFLDAWNVAVYSTNYLRTIMSVQSFLDGMLGTKCYEFTQNQHTRSLQLHVHKEERVPDHSWAKVEEHGTQMKNKAAMQRHDHDDDDTLVGIRVRNLANDPLNAFDRNPDLIAELVSEVMLSPDFLNKDAGAAPLAARLANFLPGLVRPFRSDFSAKSPSGINWVEAADHFVWYVTKTKSLCMFTEWTWKDRVRSCDILT
ncbi:hypothetical protein MPSEU_000803200 [Mayamaea pseudoterrestris]|nr:hypothetical protein MPSEU_000803200 [Mayamaea pseudoterrestris]